MMNPFEIPENPELETPPIAAAAASHPDGDLIFLGDVVLLIS